jgi:hypothetical protein
MPNAENLEGLEWHEFLMEYKVCIKEFAKDVSLHL